MDLADQIDDYICTIDGVGDLTMDMLAMVLFAWAVIALFLVWLAKFLYGKYAAKKKNAAAAGAAPTSGTEIKAKGSLLGTSATTDDLISRTGRELSKDRVSDDGMTWVVNWESEQRGEGENMVSNGDLQFIQEGSVKPLGAGKSGSLAAGRQPVRSGVLGSLTQPAGMRKRLSRKSPGPELRKPRSIQPPNNVVGPETVSVTWASQVFRWLYSDLVIVNELLGSWVHALNEYNKKSLEEVRKRENRFVCAV